MNPQAINNLLRNRRANVDAEDDSVWSILVQITLPLILVLTFVIMAQILTYKTSYYKILQSMPVRPLGVEAFNTIVLEAQLQKLLFHFETVKNQELVKLRLTMFPEANLIKRDGQSISDENFKYLCENATRILEHEKELNAYMNSFYAMVLQSAEITDTNTGSVRYWNQVEDPEVIKQGNIAGAQASVISAANRRLIHNRIVEFVQGIDKTVQNLQMQFIKLLYEYRFNNPDTIDQESKTIVAKMIETQTTDAQRQKLAKQFYYMTIEQLRTQLDTHGYPLLNSCWESLKTL